MFTIPFQPQLQNDVVIPLDPVPWCKTIYILILCSLLLPIKYCIDIMKDFDVFCAGDLPKELTGIKKLENLQLGYNHIQEIPSSYSKLTNLKSIYLQNNKLTVFPLCLCELRHLDVVDLSENKIHELPENMESLQCIELNMNVNQLKSLPASLSLCPRLKVLRVEENLLELASITSDFLRNSQVSVLAVDGNLFQVKELTDKDGYDQVSSNLMV